MTAAIAHEALALLRAQLAEAKASKFPEALQSTSVEIALSFMVGAIGGYEAERELAKLLGWERTYEIGTPSHEACATAAPVQTPAPNPNPALLAALQGLLEAREAARRVAAAGPYRGAWSEHDAAELDRLSTFVLVEGPKRWQAAQQLVAAAKGGAR